MLLDTEFTMAEIRGNAPRGLTREEYREQALARLVQRDRNVAEAEAFAAKIRLKPWRDNVAAFKRARFLLDNRDYAIIEAVNNRDDYKLSVALFGLEATEHAAPRWTRCANPERKGKDDDTTADR